jgi:hypothetical protein
MYVLPIVWLALWTFVVAKMWLEPEFFDRGRGIGNLIWMRWLFLGAGVYGTIGFIRAARTLRAVRVEDGQLVFSTYISETRVPLGRIRTVYDESTSRMRLARIRFTDSTPRIHDVTFIPIRSTPGPNRAEGGLEYLRRLVRERGEADAPVRVTA